MGFCNNKDKSVLKPTKCIEYLGNIVDSETMTITLPECRKEKIVQNCNQLLLKRQDKPREVAQVIGLLVTAFPAVELGKLHYRQLETAKIEALRKEEGNFDKWMEITDEMKTDFVWLINHMVVQDRKMFRKDTEIDLYTDASNLDWGRFLNHQITNGRWSIG